MGDIFTRTAQWFADPSHWSGTDGVWHRFGEHLWLTAVCLVISCALALPVALVLGHLGRGGALAANIANAGRAVPTFAVLVLLFISPLGNSGNTLPTVIALVLFAIPPILTNAYVGMREVDPDAREAARGMGMTGGQLLWRVELPLAAPLVMTGIRTGAVQLIATATLAALPGGGGLGRIITAGFALRDTAQVVAGAVLVALLALAVEVVFAILQRITDPHGAARRPGKSAKDVRGLDRQNPPTDDRATAPRETETEPA
ncbi:ABC transporter permease [Mangrovactinospora gilvigrisea]|uniref:ABC transporter permease n=1 Tax=Mangrovactinospora gilvigrisea TaxID=1428644 RepID=UPI0009A137BC|nr:ABC transporter permease [Mangrovactinospora gilvigrisea]